ncbi:hypothetical protein DevBK_11745 [Devosia sp. BK]|uniref:hypothetical protein n=1 Tax=unclassified Devosia TaxID=196773 RepID=UPI00071294FB|nr:MULTISPECIES: hypothetical protein [unclassified Devosia]KQT50263.1 hypothetical protein ASG47_19945 [Devosia sp. Leaf420]MDV3252006.1 hypothetical protein [Devosia sp. BK]
MSNDTPVPLSDADLDNVNGGVAAVGSSNRTGAIGNIDIGSMDLETAMMAVQSNRAALLDTQLSEQIKSVQERNTEVSELNADKVALERINSLFEPSKGDDQKVSLATKLGDTTVGAVLESLNNDLKVDANKDGMVSLGELKSSILEAKRELDSMSNSQQMDMLRLQSLSNKRNEAFDVMTNFLAKMQDARASIIGNMR